MLKKLRIRFIVSVMSAVLAVLLLFAAGICMWNDAHSCQELDRMLDGFARAEQGDRTDVAPNGFPLTGAFETDDHETEYTTRFFAVHYDPRGNRTALSMDFISTVSDADAEAYAAQAAATGKERGWLGIYRFLRVENEEGSIFIFLNASDQQQFSASLVRSSLIITGAASLMILLLIILFSRRAIRPYMKNMEQQKRFITDASHELKTPLTSIATSAEVLAMENGEGNEWIANIRRQTTHMTRLVNDLVVLSRMNEEAPFPDMTVFSLTDAVWEAAEPFEAMAKAKSLTYAQSIGEHLQVKGDQASVQRLISILLDNAVKYTLPEGTIRLSAFSRVGRPCIEVCNTCRMAQGQDTERLFDRFYRPDTSRTSATGGSGIGLAMAKAITEAHHGSIQAHYDGRSMRFTVNL